MKDVNASVTLNHRAAGSEPSQKLHPLDRTVAAGLSGQAYCVKFFL
jgi:hypothetical protein